MSQGELQQLVMTDGEINHGMVMRYWRKYVRKWKSAQILADIYNDVVNEDEIVTARTIQRMEQDNKVPMDQKRRRLLATILNIPPAYFGLTALAPYALSPDDIRPDPITSGPLDLRQLRSQLQDLWLRWAYGDVPATLRESAPGRGGSAQRVESQQLF